VRPQADEYPDHIERALAALVSTGKAAGERVLAEIAYAPRAVRKRRTPPRSVRCSVFKRDRFYCRYCGGKTILTNVMGLRADVYPEIFPFTPNWKGGLTHPAVISRSPLVDHVNPGSTSGDWLNPDNLVTACNPCNSIKADLTLEQLGWTLVEPPDEPWDGLTRYYRPLWEFAGQPDPKFHLGWLQDLER
jgi:5-methylcytosine-specific restriction endonuclease McrA